MAGKISSFLSSGLLVVKIRDVTFAYCQSLSFTQNMNVTPVGGIGSFSFNALEPTSFAANGSMRILRWDSRLMEAIKKAKGGETPEKVLPDNIVAGAGNKLSPETFGNSLLDNKGFNPVELLLSATFDIDIYERGTNILPQIKDSTGKETQAFSAGDALYGQQPLLKFLDCRLTDYSFDFAPGQLLFENVNYVCSQIQERQ